MRLTFAPLMKKASISASIGLVTLSLCVASLAYAQDGPSLEELEEQVAQQRIALEEAIANREATAAKVAEVQAELDESEEQRQQIAEELKLLCDEQESLNPGSFDNCMSSSDS